MRLNGEKCVKVIRAWVYWLFEEWKIALLFHLHKFKHNVGKSIIEIDFEEEDVK